MKKSFFSSIACSLILITLCSACKSTTKIIDLSEKDNNSEITIEKGDRIQVTLEANMTTGYQWEWVSEDATILEQKGDPEYKTGGDQLGAGGLSTFTFDAKETGSGTLHLIYHRTFEEGVAPIKEFSVSIQVK